MRRNGLFTMPAGRYGAAPFDTGKLAVVGNATEIASGVNEQDYVAQASAAANGTVAFAPGEAEEFHAKPVLGRPSRDRAEDRRAARGLC